MSRAVVQFCQENIRGLHDMLDGVVDGLTPEQLNWWPQGSGQGGGTSIAFSLWHWVRTEDNVIRFVLQRRPTVWLEQGWDQKFGLDPKAQGTGMSTDQAHQVRLPSVEAFKPYMDAVRQDTMGYLGSVDDTRLEDKVKLMPFGEVPVSLAIGRTVVTHGFSHLGEMWLLRSLQGMKGSPI